MALSVRLLSISWENIRAFHSLNAPLMHGDSHTDWPADKSIWLQMPNGTGKTSTLRLIRSVFIGRLWSKDESDTNVRGWRRITSVDKSKQAYSNAKSTFKLRLKIDDQNWAIRIELNYGANTYEFFTHHPTEGVIEGWHPPYKFKKVFEGNIRLVELFIFDGETVDRMLSQADSKLLDDAIRQFSGVAEIYGLVGDRTDGKYTGGRLTSIRNELEREVGRENSAGNAQKLTQLASLEQATIEKMETLKGEREEHKKQLADAQTDLDEVKDELRKIENNYGKKYEKALELQGEIAKRRLGMIETTEQLRLGLLNPRLTFSLKWKDFVAFHQSHIDGNLPEDVGYGWLKNLTLQKKCICGEPMTPSMSNHIRTNFSLYLDSTKRGVVSSVQSEFVRDEPQPERIEDLVSRLKMQQADIKTHQTRYEQDFAKYADPEVQVKKRSLEENQDLLSKTVSDIEMCIRHIESDDIRWLRGLGRANGLTSTGQPDLTRSAILAADNLNILGRVLEEIQSRRINAQGTHDVWNGLRTVQGTLHDSLSQLLLEQRDFISKEASRIWTGMPAAKSEGEIRLKIEDGGLNFYRGTEQERADGLSGAQERTACYSVAKSLANIGALDVPILIDTPLAGIDEDLTEEVYHAIIQEFPQSLVFLNTAEKRTMIENSWKQGFGTEVFTATIHQIGTHTDGGKLCTYTEDKTVFEELRGNSDTLPEGVA